MAKINQNEMSFLDHLEDLRWLLVRSTIAIIIMAFFTYFVSDYLFDVIIFGPTRPTFFTYVYFCELSHSLGIAERQNAANSENRYVAPSYLKKG